MGINGYEFWLYISLFRERKDEMKYYVDINANEFGKGTQEAPFKSIQQAADSAVAGDEVLVYPGIYRENVNPKNGGTENARITYRSVEPLKAVITGAEELTGWQRLEGDVWTAAVPNEVFGDFNPYEELVSGDWFIAYMTAHLGDVFLNGKSMYEVTDIDQVKAPVRSRDSWDPDFSVYVWHAKVDHEKNQTIFWANFGEYDPNKENIEITVRRNCFYPQEEGRGYITLSGFTVCKAATQWAPPTAYQEGMVGPHWSKGWIIEDCDISEAKCSGISLGKYLQPDNDNKWLKYKYKDGTQTERDCICQASYDTWKKELVGSHVVRRCTIHDCGQTGIVGHLGGAFSVIEDNHIYNINNKQNLAGAEIGGIKMHAAIDVIFRRNVIHHCTRGIWLDWQAQGTRVTQNLFYDNTFPHMGDEVDESIPYIQGTGEDIFIEVSHGPTLIDNNLLLSTRALKLATQGVAVVHNFIAGSLVAVGMGTENGAKTMSSSRYTPYHVPHRTEVAGFMTFLHGDMRFYNNVFVQGKAPAQLKFFEERFKKNPDTTWDDDNVTVGTFGYDEYPTFEEWDREFEGYCGMGSPESDRYYMHLPVWFGGNAYFNGAIPCVKDNGAVVDQEHTVTYGVEVVNGKHHFVTNIQDFLQKDTCDVIGTKTLGMAFEPEQEFENPDGTPIVFDRDYYGNKRSGRATAGAIQFNEIGVKIRAGL